MKKSLTLLFVAGTLMLAGCSTAHHEHASSRWEYMKVYTIEAANKAAAEGWVVTGYSAYVDAPNTSYSHAEIYLLKRPKQ